MRRENRPAAVSYVAAMLDTLDVARPRTDVQFTQAQADAITSGVPRNTAATSAHDQFKAGLAELRAETAGRRPRAAETVRQSGTIGRSGVTVTGAVRTRGGPAPGRRRHRRGPRGARR